MHQQKMRQTVQSDALKTRQQMLQAQQKMLRNKPRNPNEGNA